MNQETNVLAWGQLGRQVIFNLSHDFAKSLSYRVSPKAGNELGVVLLCLTEYLGHPNVHVVVAALNELNWLVQAHETQALELFRPFWRSISNVAVGQLDSRPQVINNLVELLGPEMNITGFLKLETTRYFTLPYLVMSGKKETIQKIAQVAGKTGEIKTVHQVCHDNMASIMPVLLTMDNTGSISAGENALRLLENISLKFGNFQLWELVWPEAAKIAVELLKMAGDSPEDRELEKRVRMLLLRLKTHC